MTIDERPGDERHRRLRGDLQLACLHEFAHLALARHFGAVGFVAIMFVRASRPDDHRYAGRFQMHGALPDEAWPLVALAGTVAELVHRDPTLTGEQVLDCIRSGRAVLSAQDAALSAGFEPRHVVRCHAIVRRLWNEICTSALERAREVERDHVAAGWWQA